MTPSLQSQIERTILNLTKLAPSSITLQRLPGDASDRQYYRAKSCNNLDSWIIMMLAGAGKTKAEEKTPGDTEQFTELPFVNVARYFRQLNVLIPTILHECDDFLILQDLGDETIHSWCTVRSENEHEKPYELALIELLKLHDASFESHQPACIGHTRRFTQEVLQWEFEHFLEYGIEWLTETRLKASKRDRFLELTDSFSREICSWEPVLNHRDFHSKNLLLHQEQVYVIDFQDAILGPREYDVASLLNDSYISHSDAFIKNMCQFYIDHSKVDLDLKQFIERYQLTAIQRNLKAAGRFAYILAEKGRDSHMHYVWPTLVKVRSTAQENDPLQELMQLIPFDSIQDCLGKKAFHEDEAAVS